MLPSEITTLASGIEGFTVEAVIAVVFDGRDGKFGPTQDMKIKDAAETPRDGEIVLRLRDRTAIPRDARGRTITVVPGEYKGKRTGVKWNVRTAPDGRVFKEIVVSRSARVAIQGLGEVTALPKADVQAPAPVATATVDETASFSDFAAGKASATPAATVKAEAAPAAPKAAVPVAPAPSTQPPRNGNGHGYGKDHWSNGKGQYTAEDLVALAGYFAPKILALGLPESAVGQVLDGLLRVATVTGTRPPEQVAPAEAPIVIPILKAPSKDQIEFALKSFEGDITGLLEAAHEAGAEATKPEEIPIPVLKKVVLDRINNAKAERTRAAAAA